MGASNRIIRRTSTDPTTRLFDALLDLSFVAALRRCGVDDPKLMDISMAAKDERRRALRHGYRVNNWYAF